MWPGEVRKIKQVCVIWRGIFTRLHLNIFWAFFSPLSRSRLYPYRVAVLLAPSSIRECLLALSCTSSCSKPQRLMSDFTVSFHRCRGLPLLLLPPTCIFVTWRISSSSSLRQTWPCHYDHANEYILSMSDNQTNSHWIFDEVSCISVLWRIYMRSHLCKRRWDQ